MTHENITFDDVFHQTNYLDSLQYIPHVLTGDQIPLDPAVNQYYVANGLMGLLPLSNIPYKFQITAAHSALINTYLSNYSLPSIPGAVTPTQAFTNFSALETGIYAALGRPVDNAFYNGLLQDYCGALNISVDDAGTITGGDWTVLLESPIAVPLTNLAKTTTNNPFLGALNHFLSTYTYPQSPIVSDLDHGYFTDFIQKWKTFISSIALLKAPAPSDPPIYNELITYEGIYTAFAADPSPLAFKNRLNQFYQDQMNEHGFFNPSQSLAAWVTAIRNENDAAKMNLDLIGLSLSGNSSEKAIILNRIIRLLISLIKTLQDVGIAQANRLTFITKFQNVYTALQTQIPVFLKDSSKPLGVSTTEAGQARNDLNSSFNGVLTDNLRSLRGIQEDAAKKVQTSVNHTNDAVNQQTDMASTFIQQLSTLLSTILR